MVKSFNPSYLGPGVSRNLSFGPASPKLLDSSLPELTDFADLAAFFGLSMGQTLWLCYFKYESKSDHYYRFSVEKPSGGLRHLAAPKKTLASIQKKLKVEILDRTEPHPACCSYYRGRSILDCAKPHQSTSMVVRIDIQDFFPSIGFGAIRNIFENLGYNQGIATCLSLICCDVPRIPVFHNGRRYFRASGHQHLPQGACTSPALSNLFFETLDKRFTELAVDLSCNYTRYADDLFFSAQSDAVPKHFAVANLIKNVIIDLGRKQLKINTKKILVRHKHQRQSVLGLTVNEKAMPNRQWRRRFRTEIDWCEKYSLYPYLAKYIRGKYEYLHMVQPQKANDLELKHPWLAKRPPRSVISHESLKPIALVDADVFRHPELGLVMFLQCLNEPESSEAKPSPDRLGYIVSQNYFAYIPWREFEKFAKKPFAHATQLAIIEKIRDSGEIYRYLKDCSPSRIASVKAKARDSSAIGKRLYRWEKNLPKHKNYSWDIYPSLHELAVDWGWESWGDFESTI